MENEEENKNLGYKAAIIILIALLITSNIVQLVRYNDAEEGYGESMSALVRQFLTEPIIDHGELDPFIKELDSDYIYIIKMEPIGFINYSIKYTGFRTVMYNVTFNFITEAEANGSVEFWLRNYTYDSFMTFDVAVANDMKPMVEGNLYEFYHIYSAYNFFNVIYYKIIETGKVR